MDQNIDKIIYGNVETNFGVNKYSFFRFLSFLICIILVVMRIWPQLKVFLKDKTIQILNTCFILLLDFLSMGFVKHVIVYIYYIFIISVKGPFKH